MPNTDYRSTLKPAPSPVVQRQPEKRFTGLPQAASTGGSGSMTLVMNASFMTLTMGID